MPGYCDAAIAEDRRLDVGARGVVIIGDGEPSNDMIGYGVVGRWGFGDSWRLGIALDSVTFDYETPYRALGIDSVEELDPSNEFTRASVFIERAYGAPASSWSSPEPRAR